MLLQDDDSFALFPLQNKSKKIKKINNLSYSKLQEYQTINLEIQNSHHNEDYYSTQFVGYDLGQLRIFASQQEQQILSVITRKKKKENKLYSQWKESIQQTPLIKKKIEEENQNNSSHSDTVSFYSQPPPQKLEHIESIQTQIFANQDIDRFFNDF